MVKVILRQKAIDDLTDIWEYSLQEWSENQADIYYRTIEYACKEIGQKPNSGKSYNEISKNLSGLKTGKYIIFYHQISEDEIEVIRILHERMDLKSRINE